MHQSITYSIAHTESDFNTARELFREYISQLGVDLSFQHVEEELLVIAQQYAAPDGGVLLATVDGQPGGCAGVRRLDAGTAELKRMYVRPAFRGLGIGYRILDESLTLARALGYERIRLDTLEPMTKARNLYEAAGFYPIPPYRYNPLEGAIFMEKLLGHAAVEG